MTYDVIATYSQVTSLLMFVAMFLGVLVYALWPSNRQTFNKAAHMPLDEEPEL